MVTATAAGPGRTRQPLPVTVTKSTRYGYPVMPADSRFYREATF